MYLMVRAVDAIEHYPIFGIGARNFPTYSGIWRDVHMTYLQIAAEGGIPVLIIYLMFFRRGFQNLKMLRKRNDLDANTTLVCGGAVPVRWSDLSWERYLLPRHISTSRILPSRLPQLCCRPSKRWMKKKVQRRGPALPPPKQGTSFPGGL